MDVATVGDFIGWVKQFLALFQEFLALLNIDLGDFDLSAIGIGTDEPTTAAE